MPPAIHAASISLSIYIYTFFCSDCRSLHSTCLNLYAAVVVVVVILIFLLVVFHHQHWVYFYFYLSFRSLSTRIRFLFIDRIQRVWTTKHGVVWLVQRCLLGCLVGVCLCIWENTIRKFWLSFTDSLLLFSLFFSSCVCVSSTLSSSSTGVYGMKYVSRNIHTCNAQRLPFSFFSISGITFIENIFIDNDFAVAGERMDHVKRGRESGRARENTWDRE